MTGIWEGIPHHALFRPYTELLVSRSLWFNAFSVRDSDTIKERADLNIGHAFYRTGSDGDHGYAQALRQILLSFCFFSQNYIGGSDQIYTICGICLKCLEFKSPWLESERHRSLGRGGGVAGG